MRRSTEPDGASIHGIVAAVQASQIHLVPLFRKGVPVIFESEIIMFVRSYILYEIQVEMMLLQCSRIRNATFVSCESSSCADPDATFPTCYFKKNATTFALLSQHNNRPPHDSY